MARVTPLQPAPRSGSGARGVALPLALGASLALHAGLGLALGVRAGAEDTSGTKRVAFEDFTVPQDPDDPRFVALGNPDSQTTSLTWIGYEEFEEMWAPKSEIDQAEQNPEDPGEPVPPQPLADESEQETSQTTADTPSPTEAAQPDPADQEEFVTPKVADQLESPSHPEEISIDEFLQFVDALEDIAADIPRFNPIEALRERREAVAARLEADQEAAPEAQQPSNAPDPKTEVAENPKTSQPAESGQNGQKAQREADAATINPIRKDDLGKPLATQGLSIRTVRPNFSNVTLATARPRNPVAQIDFRRNGKPIRVSIIKSSGHEQVDIDIRKALYSWRASGEALLQLPDPEDPDSPAFVSIKLEILL